MKDNSMSTITLSRAKKLVGDRDCHIDDYDVIAAKPGRAMGPQKHLCLSRMSSSCASR